MPLMDRMRDSIWSWVSPKSAVHRKTSRAAIEKSTSRKTPPLKSNVNIAYKALYDEITGSSPWTGSNDSTFIGSSPLVSLKMPATKNENRALISRKSKSKSRSVDPTYKPRQDAADMDADDAEDGDTTLVSTHPKTKSPVASPDAAYRPTSRDGDHGADDQDFEYIDRHDDKFQNGTSQEADQLDEVYDERAESDRLLKELQRMHREGWVEGEIGLYLELDARGTKPLFPDNWGHRDLPTLPIALFAGLRAEAEFFMIRNTLGSEFRAIRACSDVIDLGPWVRDARDTGNRPELTTIRAARKFFKWVLQDAHMRPSPGGPSSSSSSSTTTKALTNLVFHAGSRHTPTTHMRTAVLRRCRKVSARLRARRGNPTTSQRLHPSNFGAFSATKMWPTVYGLIASHTLFTIVSYNEARSTEELRSIGVYDFRDMTMDVWNSLALMILAVHCRDEMKDGLLRDREVRERSSCEVA